MAFFGRARCTLMVGMTVMGLVFLCGCELGGWSSQTGSQELLDIMPASWQKNLDLDRELPLAFGKQIPKLESRDGRPTSYNRLLRVNSSEPHLLQVDMVRPSMPARDLTELRLYRKDGREVFAPSALALRSDSQLQALSQQRLDRFVVEPGLLACEENEVGSRETPGAVNLILRRKADPDRALAELEATLVRITGLPASTYTGERSESTRSISSGVR